MNEKEFMVKLSEQWVLRAQSDLAHAKQNSVESYKKLESDYNKTVYELNLAVKEAKIKRDNMDKKSKKTDILLAETAVEKAEKALEFGLIKAKADLETGYNYLKLDIKHRTAYLSQEELGLAFAQAEYERGFTI